MATPETELDHQVEAAPWPALVEHGDYSVVHGPVGVSLGLYGSARQRTPGAAQWHPGSDGRSTAGGYDYYGPSGWCSVLAVHQRTGVVGSLEWYPETEYMRADADGWAAYMTEYDGHGADEFTMIAMPPLPMTRNVRHMIKYVRTNPGHRRRGIATMMLRAAQVIEPRVRNSDCRTSDGDYWAHGNGAYVPPLYTPSYPNGPRPSQRTASMWEREVRSVWSGITPEHPQYDIMSDPLAAVRGTPDYLKALH